MATDVTGQAQELAAEAVEALNKALAGAGVSLRLEPLDVIDGAEANNPTFKLEVSAEGVRAIAAALPTMRSPHWTDYEIVLNLEGQPISIFGEAVEGDIDRETAFIYQGARTVAEAQRVHAAWLAWRDAVTELGGKKELTQAERERVARLDATFEALKASLLDRR